MIDFHIPSAQQASFPLLNFFRVGDGLETGFFSFAGVFGVAVDGAADEAVAGEGVRDRREVGGTPDVGVGYVAEDFEAGGCACVHGR